MTFLSNYGQSEKKKLGLKFDFTSSRVSPKKVWGLLVPVLDTPFFRSRVTKTVPKKKLGVFLTNLLELSRAVFFLIILSIYFVPCLILFCLFLVILAYYPTIRAPNLYA